MTEILDAILVIGRADPRRVHSALAGLPQELQDAAQAAHEHLERVAWRLASRRIACEVRMEGARLRAQCVAAELAPTADEVGTQPSWRSPPLDVLHLLIEAWPCDEVGADGRWRGGALMAQLSQTWQGAVASWRVHQRHVALPDHAGDAALRVVGRSCPALEELDLSADDDLGNRLVTNVGVAEMARGCPRLRVLRLTNCRLVTGAALVEVARSCPQLSTLGIAGCGYVRIGKNLTDAPLWKSDVAGLRRVLPSLRRLTFFACLLPADEPQYAALADWEGCTLERLDCAQGFCQECSKSLKRHRVCGRLLVNCPCVNAVGDNLDWDVLVNDSY